MVTYRMSHCPDCNLFSQCRQKLTEVLSPFSGSYKTKNKILVISDHPDESDDLVGHHQSEEKGHDIVLDFLSGLECKWIFTTALTCAPKEPKKMKRQYDLCFEEKVKPLILAHKPKAIVVLHKKALQALLGDSCPTSTTSIETTGYEYEIEGVKFQVFSLPHPALFNAEKTDKYKLKNRYLTCLGKAEDYAIKADDNQEIPFNIVTDVSQFRKLLSVCPEVFAFDVENNYSNKDLNKNIIWKDGVKLLTLSVTFRNDRMEYENFVIASKALEDIDCIKALFRNRVCIAHNISHDAAVLSIKRGVDVYKLCKDFHDTMVLFYISDQNRRRNGLKPLATHYLKVADWETPLDSTLQRAEISLKLRKQTLSKSLKALTLSQDKWPLAAAWDEDGRPKLRGKKSLTYGELLVNFASKQDIDDCISQIESELNSLPKEGTLDMGDVPVETVAQYNACDTLYTLRLYYEILPILAELDGLSLEDQDPLWDPMTYDLMKKMIRTLAHIEKQGMALDLDGLLKFDKDLDLKVNEIKSKLFKLPEVKEALDSVKEVINSKERGTITDDLLLEKLTPKTQAFVQHLAKAFGVMSFAKITKGNKLSFGWKEIKNAADYLEGLGEKYQSNILYKLVEMRVMLDLHSKTTLTWIKFLCSDKKLHTKFKTISNMNIGFQNSEESGGAQSGRLSSQDPSFHQIPKDDKFFVRQYIRATPGYKFVEIDFSAGEPVLISMVSNCPGLKKIFNEGKDIYLAAADEIFGMQLDWSLGNEVLKESHKDIRKLLKVGFLAWCYGQSEYSFAKHCGISLEQAHEFFEKARVAYKEVYDWKESIISAIKNGEYIRTLFGRKRKFPLPIVSDWTNFLQVKEWKKTFAKACRVGVNFPIQSCLSDITLWQASIILEWIEVNNLDNVIKIVNVVHDSIWFEIKEGQVEKYTAILSEMMVDLSTLPFDMDVSMKVESTEGYHLGESMDPVKWSKSHYAKAV